MNKYKNYTNQHMPLNLYQHLPIYYRACGRHSRAVVASKAFLWHPHHVGPCRTAVLLPCHPPAPREEEVEQRWCPGSTSALPGAGVVPTGCWPRPRASHRLRPRGGTERAQPSAPPFAFWTLPGATQQRAAPPSKPAGRSAIWLFWYCRWQEISLFIS